MLKQYCKSPYLTSSAKCPFWRRQFPSLGKPRFLNDHTSYANKSFTSSYKSPVPVRSKVQGKVRSSPLTLKVARSKILIYKTTRLPFQQKKKRLPLFSCELVLEQYNCSMHEWKKCKNPKLFSALSSPPLEISKPTLHTCLCTETSTLKLEQKQRPEVIKSYCIILFYEQLVIIDDTDLTENKWNMALTSFLFWDALQKKTT